MPDRRRVGVAPDGGEGRSLLLAWASGEYQTGAVGNQSGGRVFLFIRADDLRRDHERYRRPGVRFVREKVTTESGIVAVCWRKSAEISGISSNMPTDPIEPLLAARDPG